MSCFRTFSTFIFQCEPLKGRVAKILTWRWTEPIQEEGKLEELDHTHPHLPASTRKVARARKINTTCKTELKQEYFDMPFVYIPVC